MYTTQRQLIRMSLRLLVAAPLMALASLAPTPVHAAGILGASFSMPPNNLSLVGYWPFDGKYLSTTTATDASGQGNNGTLVNGPTPAIGRIGQALSFDGANDYASVANNASLNIGTSDAAFSAWIKPSNAAATSGIITKRHTVTTFQQYDFSVGYINNSGNFVSSKKIGCFFYNGGALGTTNTQSAYTTNDVVDGNWHFVQCVRQNGSSLKMYVDGVSVPVTYVFNGTTNVNPDSTDPVYIGASGPSLNFFNGPIDDVRIYNRALSATEIAQLYTQGSGNHISTSPNIIGGATSGLSSGLVGYWPLDGKYLTTTTVTDVSGQGNNGTLVNGPIPTIGKIGQALKFNGTNQLITIPDSVSLRPVSALTVCAWFNAISLPSSPYSAIATKPYTTASWLAPYLSWLIRFNNPTTIEYEVTNTSYSQNTATVSVSLNTWYNTCMTYDGTTTKLYLNAVLKGSSTSVSGNILYSSQPVLIGADYGGSPYGEYFNGTIDDVRVYNRALSATEIAQLYTQGSGNHISTSPQVIKGASVGLSFGLVGYWPFDGKYLTTTTATDISGSGKDGTLVNGPIPTIGKIGQALSFNGTTQYVSAGTSPTGGLSTMTVSTWVKTTDPSAANQILVEDGNGYTSNSFYLNLNTGKPEFEIYTTAGAYDVVTASAAIPANTWTHIVGTWTSGSRVKVYVNGVLVSGTAGGTLQSSPLITGNTNLGIGSRPGAPPTLYLKGSLDDVRIYNRALSATEIRQLYKQGGGF